MTGSRELVDAYRAHVEQLGRDRPTRRFLLTLMLTTRYHLASRPISSANQPFSHRLCRSCDALLEVLQAPGWEPLDDSLVEEGIAAMRPLSGPGSDGEHSMTSFRHFFRRYFRSLNLPWSCLAPSGDMTLEDWPAPRVVLLSVGLNIGIGDELILFQLAQGLRKAYPNAELRVLSTHDSLWSLCDCVDRHDTTGVDQLAHFVAAQALLAAEPDSLVVFAEFASAPAYRQLERLPGIGRFVYFDTGHRCVRLVDQSSQMVRECSAESQGRIYAALWELMTQIGLPSPREREISRLGPPAPRAHSGIPSVFVNPFSSKRFDEVPPEWWAGALAEAHSLTPLRAVVFAGVDDACHRYSDALVDACAERRVDAVPYGRDHLPTVVATLTEAGRAQAVFGLDTFTAHVGVVSPVPCVTVFFGSVWDPWRVGDNHVLNIYTHTSEQLAGRLVARLLAPPSAEVRDLASALVNHTRQHARALEGGSNAREALATLASLERLVGQWLAVEPALKDVFSDLPAPFAEALESALRSSLERHSESDDVQTGKLIERATAEWMDGNLFRYACFVASLEERDRSGDQITQAAHSHWIEASARSSPNTREVTARSRSDAGRDTKP